MRARKTLIRRTNTSGFGAFSTTTSERANYEIKRHHFQGRAATSTVEALMVGLRERGMAAFMDPKVERRLGEVSPRQLREVIARLIKLRPQCRSITDELLLQLEDRLP